MKNLNTQATLFIICPFCQLEPFLRSKFSNNIFFLTAPAGVLNFSPGEISAIKHFIKREQVTDIYLVNDVSCNFINEAINTQKEFGLRCERELRMQWQNININLESHHSLETLKEILARYNVREQLAYLNTERILKHEVCNHEIQSHGLITDKVSATIHPCN